MTKVERWQASRFPGHNETGADYSAEIGTRVGAALGWVYRWRERRGRSRSIAPIEGSATRKSGPLAAGWAAAAGYLRRRVAPAKSNRNNAAEDLVGRKDDDEMPSRMDSFLSLIHI